MTGDCYLLSGHGGQFYLGSSLSMIELGVQGTFYCSGWLESHLFGSVWYHKRSDTIFWRRRSNWVECCRLKRCLPWKNLWMRYMGLYSMHDQGGELITHWVGKRPNSETITRDYSFPLVWFRYIETVSSWKLIEEGWPKWMWNLCFWSRDSKRIFRDVRKMVELMREAIQKKSVWNVFETAEASARRTGHYISAWYGQKGAACENHALSWPYSKNIYRAVQKHLCKWKPVICFGLTEADKVCLSSTCKCLQISQWLHSKELR